MIESVDQECVTDPDIGGGNFRVYSRNWSVMGRAPCTPAWNCGGPLLKREALSYGNSGNKKRATWFAKNELKSDVARFTTHEKNLATLFVARQVRTWVEKRATSLYNSFGNNIARQVAPFCCPFYWSFNNPRNWPVRDRAPCIPSWNCGGFLLKKGA